jgi:hypothetical protein
LDELVEFDKTDPMKAKKDGIYSAPVFRKLRAFAFDPGLATELQNFEVSEVMVTVPWESLEAGPVGEYLEVVDVDPASGCAYAPVDLEHPHLIASDGLAPSEGNPQFHQQMVYAVGMKTIRHFEKALGRKVFWSTMRVSSASYRQVDKLRIYPHALRENNAYYDSDKKALLFGYFPARPEIGNEAMPGGMVFTCLSHDIIAHEMTHAVLDGVQRYFIDPSNADALAFHEAFADIVALFQHFTYPEILENQLARVRGDLEVETFLGKLAVQFGNATGARGALRDAIGGLNPETGKWQRSQPDPKAYETVMEPHERGAILVAAVFDAFLAIYRKRTEDLFRIASGGTGMLPKGDIHPDLVKRLAKEASRTAGQILQMCIRAIDYCPPVDITFGDYLRALITADVDLVPVDDWHYRVAMIEAFRKWGIFPSDVRTLSVESLRWERPVMSDSANEFLSFMREIFFKEKKYVDMWEALVSGTKRVKKRGTSVPSVEKLSREELLRLTARFAAGLHDGIKEGAVKAVNEGKMGSGNRVFGFNFDQGHAEDCKFEVHSVRPLRRTGPDGRTRDDLIIQITQRRPGYYDDAEMKTEMIRYRLGKTAPDFDGCDFKFRGGTTFILDLEQFTLRYAVSKDILANGRLDKQRKFLSDTEGASLRALYLGGSQRGQALASLHSHTGF